MKNRITPEEIHDWVLYDQAHPLDWIRRLEAMMAKTMWLMVNLWRKAHQKRPNMMPLDAFFPRFKPKTPDEVKEDIRRAFQNLPNEIIDKRKMH